MPELALDSGLPRSRSIDVALVRVTTGEAVVAEIWDWFHDVGASLRGLDRKVIALAARLADDASLGAQRGRLEATDWRVQGLFVVRHTRRNRSLVAELRPLFAARFEGSSVGWMRALVSQVETMPEGHGFLWSDSRTHLIASRLRRPGS